MKSEWLGGNSQAIAILRVSSSRQRDNTSHEVQASEVKRYCESTGLKLAKTEAITESAKDSDDRKKYNALISWALANKIRHVLFYMADRESRNLTDTESNEKLVLQDRIVIHYVRDNKVLHKGSPDSDFCMRDIQAAINKDLSRKVQVKVSDSMRTKAESGWYPSNKPPLGYIPKSVFNEDGRERKRGKIVARDTNEKNVQQVLREFELRAEGYSFQEIRKRIVEEGYFPANRIKNYHASAVENRLKNPFYRGKFLWQGKVYDGKHEVIIPSRILDAVDASLYKKNFVKKDTTAENIFSGGWIRCAECGCNVVHDPKTKTAKGTRQVRIFDYYHCTNGRRVHATMKGMNVTGDKLWSQFENALDQISITDSLAADIANALNQAQDRTRSAMKREMSDYADALKGLELEEDALYGDLKKGLLDDSAYQRQLARIRSERSRFTALLQQASLSITDASMETAKSILELAINAKSLWKKADAQERRKRLEEVLSNPVLEGVTLRYEIKKPFRILSEMALSSKWRTREGSNL